MRTKTLLLTAAAIAAGFLSASAQVYSVNVVGYVNVTVPPQSFVLVANPLAATNNTLDALLAGAPLNATRVWYWSGSGWLLTTKRAAGFTPAVAHAFNPGEGFFIQNTNSTPFTNTFVGEVLQGSQAVTYPVGFTPLGCVTPMAGTVETQLGFPAYFLDNTHSDKVWTFDTASGLWQTATRRAASWSGTYYVPGGSPGAGQPVINVAQGFFVEANNAAGGTWTRNFTVQ